VQLSEVEKSAGDEGLSDAAVHRPTHMMRSQALQRTDRPAAAAAAAVARSNNNDIDNDDDEAVSSDSILGMLAAVAVTNLNASLPSVSSLLLLCVLQTAHFQPSLYKDVNWSFLQSHRRDGILASTRAL